MVNGKVSSEWGSWIGRVKITVVHGIPESLLLFCRCVAFVFYREVSLKVFGAPDYWFFQKWIKVRTFPYSLVLQININIMLVTDVDIFTRTFTHIHQQGSESTHEPLNTHSYGDSNIHYSCDDSTTLEPVFILVFCYILKGRLDAVYQAVRHVNIVLTSPSWWLELSRQTGDYRERILDHTCHIIHKHHYVRELLQESDEKFSIWPRRSF